ncbi:MAG: hypothetical protein ACKV22_21815 [Bryobacteraceae bacterium]
MLPGLGENSESVRAELQSILANSQFARSKRSSDLLRYLVEQALEGKSENLKEYVLAVEVFGRDESFDPRIETLVRVEANRLRHRLKAYYEGPGSQSRLRIEVPVGAYVPEFTRSDSPPVGQPRSVWRSRAWPLACAAILPLLVWLGVDSLHHREPVGVRALSRLTHEDTFTAYPALAPGGQWIVYASDRGGGGFLHLWKQALPAGEPVPLTSGDCDDTTPSVSRDGGRIAFRSTCGPEGIYLIPATGGARRLVAYFGRDPSFSPDNRALVYWTRDPHTRFGRLYIARVDIPAEPVRIAREFDDAHTPAWTLDGKHVLLCGTRRTRSGPTEEHDLWVVAAEGGTAVKTGAFSHFARLGLDPHPEALPGLRFGWLGGEVLFPARLRDSVNLWRAPMSASWVSQPDVFPLLAATSYQLHPAVAGSTLALTQADLRPRVWSVPVNGQGARAAGPPVPVTRRSVGLAPSVSADGRTLVFLAPNGANQLGIWKKAPIEAPEQELPRLAGPTTRVRISPDGSTAYYRVLEGDSGLRRQVIYAADLESGNTRRVCGDCGAPTDVTPDGRLLIYEAPNTLTRLAAVRIATGEKWEFAEHSHHALGEARVSADGRWIAFIRDREPDGRQVMAAPFHEAEPIAETGWIPITEPGDRAQDPSWSPDGRFLYFISDRDGRRCVWAQPLAATRRPEGRAVAVHHFHNAGLNPFTFDDRPRHYVGFSAAGNRLFLSLLETKSSVWLGELQAK